MFDIGDVFVYISRAPHNKKESEKELLSSVRDYAARTEKPLPKRLEILREPHKKPRLNVPSIHCSVSHSGSFWVCGVSPWPVGLDVEKHRKSERLEKIAQRFFHPEEYAYLNERHFSPEAFFPLWTAKESYVKFTGEGISDSYSSFSVVASGKIDGTRCGVAFRHLTLEGGYSFCICSEHLKRVKLIYRK